MIRIGAPAALIEAILDPRTLNALDLRGWERMLSCARRNAVLAYLAERAMRAGAIDAVPEVPREALLSAHASAARLAQLARWEVDRVRRALAPSGIPIIALKGVAYVLRGLPHASTRLMSDVDVMVPRDRIDAAEQALLAAGWEGTKLDPHDQKYYREWSHELPPLHYPGRVLGVDVHHTICAPISRLRPDAQAFWASAESLARVERSGAVADRQRAARRGPPVLRLGFRRPLSRSRRSARAPGRIRRGAAILACAGGARAAAGPRPAAPLRVRNAPQRAPHADPGGRAARGASVRAGGAARSLDGVDADVGIDARGSGALAARPSRTAMAALRALALAADAGAGAAATPCRQGVAQKASGGRYA